MYRAAIILYKVKLVNSKNHYLNNRKNTAKDQNEMWNRINNLVFWQPLNLIKKKNLIFEGIKFTEKGNC